MPSACFAVSQLRVSLWTKCHDKQAQMNFFVFLMVTIIQQQGAYTHCWQSTCKQLLACPSRIRKLYFFITTGSHTASRLHSGFYSCKITDMKVMRINRRDSTWHRKPHRMESEIVLKRGIFRQCKKLILARSNTVRSLQDFESITVIVICNSKTESLFLVWVWLKLGFKSHFLQ